MRSTLLQSTNYKWWAFLAISLGTFTSVLHGGSVIVALPTIADHYNTDLPTLQWIVIGYGLTISALLLPMGRLSDIVGRKQIYVSGYLVFVLGAALAGFSTNMTTLVLAQVIQGCGAAMTQATGMAMVASIFPTAERGKALGTHMSVVGVGFISGPVLGGFLVSALGWRWVFFSLIPTGILTLAAALIILEKGRFLQDSQRPKFDWLGAVLSAGTLVSLLLALTFGPRVGWASPLVMIAFLSFLVLLATFIWWELRTPAPMIDLELFKRRTLALGVLAGFITFLGNSPVIFLMPLYLQFVLGYSPDRVGLILVPTALAMLVMGPISGRLSDRYGWRRFTVGGLAISAFGLFLLTRISESSSLWMVMAGMIVASSGMGMFNSPNNAAIFSTAEQGKFGVVSGLIQLIRNSANVTSIAVSTAIVTATMASMGYPPSLAEVSDANGEAGIFGAFTSGLGTVYLAMGVLLLVGLVITVLMGDRPKEAPAKRIAEPRAGDA